MRRVRVVTATVGLVVLGFAFAGAVAHGALWRSPGRAIAGLGATTIGTTVTESTSTSTTTAPPAKGEIAYSVPMEEGPLDWDMFVMNADGNGQVRLTFGGDDPVWSPDGHQIAFTIWSGPPELAGIWIMKADGSKQERVLVATDVGGISWAKAR
jgi:hypothetical protein